MLCVYSKISKCLIISIYRPPQSGNYELFNKVLDAAQIVINDHANEADDIIVCGNVNILLYNIVDVPTRKDKILRPFYEKQSR